jgi:hypothetical protein
MRKSTITKVWLAGIVAIALGLVAAAIGAGGIFCSTGTYTTALDGHVTSFQPRLDGWFWSLVAITIAGGIVALAGGIATFVAWIGAMANAYQLADKMWFLLTLLLGLVGFGLVVMILYVLLAPDSQDEEGRPTTRAASTPPTYQPSH